MVIYQLGGCMAGFHCIVGANRSIFVAAMGGAQDPKLDVPQLLIPDIP